MIPDSPDAPCAACIFRPDDARCRLRVPDDDHPREECGVFGILGHSEAAKLIYLGLYALQHRGQEGAGIVCGDDQGLNAHRGVGLVSDVFKPHTLQHITGDRGIGHVRYSTFGSSNLKNVQPLVVDYARGSMAVAHNGNLTNAALLRQHLEEQGAIFQSTTDSEVILHLISRSKCEAFSDCVIDALRQVVGAYSVLVTNGDVIVAARDPHGFRPLWLGRIDDAYVVASETCAFDIIDAEWVREIEPGEVVTLSRHRAHSGKPFPPTVPQQCLFECVYVARPDSYIFGQSVDEMRKRMGRELARAAAVDADVVMAVPDSSNPAALGYSHESGLPFDMGFIRNHYVGRTFIEPDQGIRDFGVKIKLNPSRSAVANKRILLVDDSIVRGTTARKIIQTLRRAGAREVHFRIASPRIISSCYYGIDTPNREKLIAHRLSLEETREFFNVDTLVYQELDALLRATGSNPDHFCTACFTGSYPTPTPEEYATRAGTCRHVDHSTAAFERRSGPYDA